MSSSYQHLVWQPSFLTKEAFSLLLLFVSALFYSLMGVFIQLATSSKGGDDKAPSSMELAWFRTVMQGSVLFLAMLFFRLEEEGEQEAATRRTVIQEPFGAPAVRRLVLLRGIIGGLGLTFHYYTVSVLPLGDAISLLSLNPIVTVLASSVLLGEGLKSNVWAALLSVVGSVFLARPTFLFGGAESDASSQNNWLGYVTALLGTTCAAAVYILIRKSGKTGVHTLQLLWSWCVFGFPYSTTAMVFYGDPWSIPRSRWTYTLCSALFGGSGHFLMNYACRHTPAGLAAIVRSSGILWGYLLEITVFDEIPRLSTLFGASLICIALILVAIQKHGENNEQECTSDATQIKTESTRLLVNTESKH